MRVYGKLDLSYWLMRYVLAGGVSCWGLVDSSPFAGKIVYTGSFLGVAAERHV